MKNKFLIPALTIVILIAAAGLRFYRLGHHSLWLDEIATVYGFDNVNPPVYLFLSRVWMEAAGRGELVLRLPAAIFSLLALPVIIIMGKRLFSLRAGLLAGILLAVSPYSINYAQEGRMYSLVWLLALISFYFFYRFYQDGSRRFLIGCLLVNAGSFYVSYSSILFILTENILFLFFLKKQQRKSWLWGQLIILLLLIPLLPAFWEKATRREGISWITMTSHYRDLFRGIFSYLGGDLSGRGDLWVYLPYLVLAGLGYLRVRGKRIRVKIVREDIFLAVWFAAPILIGLTINLCFFSFLSPLTIRYVGFIQFPFFLAVAHGIDRLRPAFAGGIIICLLLLTGMEYLIPYYRGDNCVRRENWRGVIASLEEKATPEDLVILLRGAGLPYRYYRTGTGEEANTRLTWPRKDIAQLPLPPNYERVFILHRHLRYRYSHSLPGYRLREHFRDGPIGYFQFEAEPEPEKE